MAGPQRGEGAKDPGWPSTCPGISQGWPRRAAPRRETVRSERTNGAGPGLDRRSVMCTRLVRGAD